MRKDVEEIVSKKMREQMSEEVNQSSVDLLKEIVDEIKNLNVCLKNNSNNSMEINYIMLVFTASAVLCAVASLTLASIQLLTDGNYIGMVVLYGLTLAIIILIIAAAKKISDSRKELN